MPPLLQQLLGYPIVTTGFLTAPRGIGSFIALLIAGRIVGKVDVRERHSFVDVAAEHANAILAKLNRAEIKGTKVKIKAA